MVAKDWKELVDKINATFLKEMSHTWNLCRDKISKMREKYREKHVLACDIMFFEINDHINVRQCHCMMMK
jgi:hypothetical protein